MKERIFEILKELVAIKSVSCSETERDVAEWFAAFPTLYDIIPGYEDLTDPRTEVMPTGCVARRNIGIGDRLQIGPTDELPFCDVGDNADYTFAENPVFVNPTLGDYRIREGSGYLDLGFEKMGRY